MPSARSSTFTSSSRVESDDSRARATVSTPASRGAGVGALDPVQCRRYKRAIRREVAIRDRTDQPLRTAGVDRRQPRERRRDLPGAIDDLQTPGPLDEQDRPSERTRSNSRWRFLRRRSRRHRAHSPPRAARASVPPTPESASSRLARPNPLAVLRVSGPEARKRLAARSSAREPATRARR